MDKHGDPTFMVLQKKFWIESPVKGIQVIGNHYPKANGWIERI